MKGKHSWLQHLKITKRRMKKKSEKEVEDKRDKGIVFFFLRRDLLEGGLALVVAAPAKSQLPEA